MNLLILQRPWNQLALIFCFSFSLSFYLYGIIPIRYNQYLFSRFKEDERISYKPVTVDPTTHCTIYVITPTYPRLVQIAELTRLAQTLMHVHDLVWIVIEDATMITKSVETLLNRTKMKFVHLVAPMPTLYKNDTNMEWKPKGVSNRNRGLDWIRANATSGVLYFADDDNTYDIRLFEEMRDTKRVSMWPVGLILGDFNAPIVRDGKVVGFYCHWTGGRLFQVDMAGFSVNIEFLLKRPNARMPFKAGFEEDIFLKGLSPFNIEDIEPKAANCTEILVWHTQTKTPEPMRPINISSYEDTNIEALYTSL